MTEVPQKIQKLAVAVTETEEAIAKATTLCQLIADNAGAFTNGEIAAARRYLIELHRRKTQLSQNLATCIRVYEEKVVNIKRKLLRRMEILEAYDNQTKFLSQNKDLMDIFAHGHATLEREMQAAEAGMGTRGQAKPMEEQ